MISLEQACSETEVIAEQSQASVRKLLRQIGSLKKAAKVGNIAGIKRCQENLKNQLEEVKSDVSTAVSSWPYTDEDEIQIFEDQFAPLLKSTAREMGFNIYEKDGNLVCPPLIVKILPAQRAVNLNRKKVSQVRPTYLVDVLQKAQNKNARHTPKQFLVSLYRTYNILKKSENPSLIKSENPSLISGDGGPVYQLNTIYNLMTALPGSSRNYDRSDFARDLYILDSEGPQVTRNGARVSFPSSTGTRHRAKSQLFTFINKDGSSVEYYGIRFSEPE